MTVELDPGGRGHHMIIVERGNGDSVQSMILTDMEIGQLACLIENYRSQLVGHVSVELADPAEGPATPRCCAGAVMAGPRMSITGRAVTAGCVVAASGGKPGVNRTNMQL